MTEREILRLAVQQGWKLARGKRHHQLRCSCGKHLVVVAGTASEYRAMKNVLANLRACPTWNRALENA